MKNRVKQAVSDSGFSLIELIIVIAIMAILVGILAGQYIGYVEKGKKTVCSVNMNQAVDSYNIARVGDESTDYREVLKDVMTGLGAKKATGTLAGANTENGLYTGLCPSGGYTIVIVNTDGSISLSCSKHTDNLAAGFASTLISKINDIKRNLSDGSTQTLADYLTKDTKHRVDSEAPDGSTGAQESFTSVAQKYLGAAVPSNQSWSIKAVKKGNVVSYVLYVTTGGKLTVSQNGSTVSTIKYTYDANGKLQSTNRVNVDVQVYNNQYAYLNIKD